MKGRCTVLYKLPFGSHKLYSVWRCLLVVLNEANVYLYRLSNRQQGCSLCLWEVCGACLSFQDYLLIYSVLRRFRWPKIKNKCYNEKLLIYVYYSAQIWTSSKFEGVSFERVKVGEV